MKHKFLITCVIMIAHVLMQNSLFAQWSTTALNTFPGIQSNRLGTAANLTGVNKLDIRFFTNAQERMRLMGEPGFNRGFLGLGTQQPQSLLHLNSTTTGNVFRTDGPATVDNNWEFWTGTTRKARIYVPAYTPNLVLQTEQGWSNILFNTFGTVI